MRYLPLTDGDRKEMLAAIGVASIDDAVHVQAVVEAIIRAAESATPAAVED